MRNILIGVPVHAEPVRLNATLASIQAHTSHPFELVLLPDGPDRVTQLALLRLPHLPQLGTCEPGGLAACFNRLAMHGHSDIVVLLESGAVVGPRWLDYLLVALDKEPRNGLAGPSTNRSWNEQGISPHAPGGLSAVARTAQEVATRFGATDRVLEPLHSLADFCYVVRREVITAVGAADERYGVGPCWEMDYNIRAARAGFRGVWACGAYVHRAPATLRRQREEDARFETSRRLYQDKFCGGRLRGDKADYRSHCEGDACSRFAPVDLIEISRPFPQVSRQEIPTDVSSGGGLAHGPLSLRETDWPLVSCIMPTKNRRRFVSHAVEYFMRQDYPNLELIVVDSGDDGVEDCLRGNERIRYLRMARPFTLGAMRNVACERARGDFIAHWDDDDWYPYWRISLQMQALQDRGADVCGTSCLFFFDAAHEHAWKYAYQIKGNSWVAGSTFLYRKSFWQRNRFPDVHVGEDARFLWRSAKKVLHDLQDPRLCVAMIHPDNTSRKVTTGAYWQVRPKEEVHHILGEDILRYRSGGSQSLDGHPLVSCIMPTYNRRAFVELALRHFALQDYVNKELIVVDDGTDGVEDLVKGICGVRYLRLNRRISIGAKRNLACQHGRGEFIAHWDDDDWYAPDRLRYQLAPLLSNEADMTGLVNSFVLQLPGGVFWTTGRDLHCRMFRGDVHGGTLVYRKALFDKGVRYPDVNLAEDAGFIQQALIKKQRLLQLANTGVFVYIRHQSNAWRFEAGRFMDPRGWRETVSPERFPSAMFDEYRLAAEKMADTVLHPVR